jgi:hypothetical protein
MNETQILTIALSTVPTMLAVLVGILINNARLGDLSDTMNARLGDLSDTMNARLGDLNGNMNSLLNDMNGRLGELRSHVDSRFDDVDRRFEEMKDLWRSELHRVEEVIDARLRHIEGR